MARPLSTSMTRRNIVTGLALAAAPAAFAGAGNAYAQTQQTKPEKTLYERLGGVFAIAAVVDHFSDALVKNPIVGQKSKNPQLRQWHTKNLTRAARSQVYAHVMGLRCFRWAFSVQGHQARDDAAWP
jgi:hemoglobin